MTINELSEELNKYSDKADEEITINGYPIDSISIGETCINNIISETLNDELEKLYSGDNVKIENSDIYTAQLEHTIAEAYNKADEIKNAIDELKEILT